MQSGKVLLSLEIRYLACCIKKVIRVQKQTQVDIYEALEGLPPNVNRPMLSGLEAEDRLLQQAIAASMQESRPGGNMGLPLEQEEGEEGELEGQRGREDELALALRLSGNLYVGEGDLCIDDVEKGNFNLDREA